MSNSSFVELAGTQTRAQGAVDRRNAVLKLLGGTVGLGMALSACDANGAPGAAVGDSSDGAIGQGLIGASNVIWCDTVADLKGLTGEGFAPGETAVVAVLGRAARGDGGGGLFEWLGETPPASDDGGTVFLPDTQPAAPDGPGYWRRIYTGPLDLRWFGASTSAGSGTSAGATNFNALKSALGVLSANGGTLLVDQMYDLGADGWGGLSIGTVDNFPTFAAAINGLRIRGTSPGAGFRVMANVPAGAVQTYFRFCGCADLELIDLAFEVAPGLENNGLVFLRGNLRPLVRGCSFTGVVSSSVSFTLQTEGGVGTRVENCRFENTQGNVFGYVNAGQLETDLILRDNRFVNTQVSGCAYVCALRAVISGNLFEGNANGGVLLLASPVASAESVVITGNTFADLGLGVRSDFGAWPFLRMKNISIVGNTFSNIANITIGIYPCDGVVITGNVLRNCGTQQPGYVIWVTSVSDAIVADNAITWDVTVSGTPTLNTGWGISVGAASPWGEADDILIKDNLVRGYVGGIFAASDISGSTLVFPCSNVSIDGNVIRGTAGAAFVPRSYGIMIGGLTDNVVLTNNEVGPELGVGCSLGATAKMFANQFKNIDVLPYFDPLTTYYWEDAGRKTLAPAASPPATLPASIVLHSGDLVYNSAPASGSCVGWVYTNAGWKAFGTLA